MGKFQLGQSGNPAGRKPGTKDCRTELRDLFRAHAPSLIAKAVEMALAGDATALRLCMDRVVSPLRATSSSSQPFILGHGSLSVQAERVTAGLAEGILSADQANALMSMITAQARILETAELARRIEALEHAGEEHEDIENP